MSHTIHRIKKDRNFTVVDNALLRDMRLSSKAKAIFITILSLPDSWDFSLTGLIKILPESKDSISAAFSELENCGYLNRDQRRNNGRFEYHYTFFEKPNPVAENTVETTTVRDKTVRKTPLREILSNKEHIDQELKDQKLKIKNNNIFTSKEINMSSTSDDLNLESEVNSESQLLFLKPDLATQEDSFPLKEKIKPKEALAEAEFAKAYKAYGRALNRNSRKASLKKWLELKRSKRLPGLDQVLIAIDLFNQSLLKTKFEQSKPGFQVWLSKERWLDVEDFEATVNDYTPKDPNAPKSSGKTALSKFGEAVQDAGDIWAMTGTEHLRPKMVNTGGFEQ